MASPAAAGSALNYGCRGGLGYKKGPQDLMKDLGEAGVMRILKRFSEDRPGFPGPAYYHEKPVKKRFGTRIYDLDIKWECGDHSAIVVAIDTGSNEDHQTL
jgi:hypothetical protein